jgi:hypothetical protein
MKITASDKNFEDRWLKNGEKLRHKQTDRMIEFMLENIITFNYHPESTPSHN